jgi:integrase
MNRMARKNANGEGTIVRRSDGRWTAAATLPNGKRKWLYGKTRTDVAQRLARIRGDRDKGLVIPGEKQTVAVYLRSWLEIVRPTVRESAWIRYEQLLRVHAIPGIGRIPLARLTPQHVQHLYADRLTTGRSPTTINHLHGVLHHALEDAVRMNLVPRNVSSLTKPPRVATHEMKVYSPEEVDTLLTAAKGHRLEAMFALAVSTGMREGEIIALKWPDVDLAKGTLQVRRGRQRTLSGYVDGNPKTDSGRRTIRLTRTATEALQSHRTRQLQERLRLGEAWEDRDLVFPSEVGTPLDGPNVLKTYYRVIKKAGLPRIRFHDLRHTAATLLLLQGVPAKVVSEMLGHANIAITLDLYSHVTPDMQEQAAAAMEDILTRRRTDRAENE